ncbi:MAG: hypothetical protein M3036_16395 [Bifidobacteriales bacterium]|nr:hypothetical protein [Bifidobacteriales bacterium]
MHNQKSNDIEDSTPGKYSEKSTNKKWTWRETLNTIAAIISACFAALGPIQVWQTEKWSQAEAVSAWDKDTFAHRIPYEPTDVVINNGSQSPIYDVIISFGVAAGAGPAYLTGTRATMIGTVPPGRWIGKAPAPDRGMSVQPNAAIAFRDAKNRSWCRDAAGRLKEITDPYSHMGITPPETFQGVKKDDSDQ